jgi:hypothetical protein
MIRFYVYRLDDPITGEFYIGSRQCECDIHDDTYMGSYTAWKPDDKSRLIKTILKSNFRKRKTALLYEIKLIKKNINDELNRNYHIPPDKFYPKGDRIKYHPFKNNKYMKQWCKNNNIVCNTVNGNDVDWDNINQIIRTRDHLAWRKKRMNNEIGPPIVLHNVLQVAPTQTKNRPY